MITLKAHKCFILTLKKLESDETTQQVSYICYLVMNASRTTALLYYKYSIFLLFPFFHEALFHFTNAVPQSLEIKYPLFLVVAYLKRCSIKE